MKQFNLEEILNYDPLNIFEDIPVKFSSPLNKYRKKGVANITLSICNSV